MLPKHFKTVKSQDLDDRRLSSTNSRDSIDLRNHFESFAKMADTTVDEDEQRAIPQRSEHATETSDIQSFESFTDESECADEQSHTNEVAGEDLSDNGELGDHHRVDHTSQEPDQVPKIKEAKPDNRDVDSKNTSANIVEELQSFQSDSEDTHSDMLAREHQHPAHSESAGQQDTPVVEDTMTDKRDLKLSPTAIGLLRYRLSVDDLALLDRKCKSLPATGTSWSIPPSWPPPRPSSDMPKVRPDVVPPEGSPLHIQIQAYALRWGTWATTIEDDQRREEVLKWVTEKMRVAWETAIKEGYYPRPVTIDHQIDCDKSDETHAKQRGRKRMQSPSRQPALFAHEGKDLLAITTGELNHAGITMEMINDRVAQRDFDAGEMLLDEVLTDLNKDKIEINDWSRTKAPSVVGRNLLMYSLFVVQESRAEIQKLERLYVGFKKDSQKKNTQVRIDMYQEREKQHLALATELHLNQAENEGTATDVHAEIVDIDSEMDGIHEISDSSAVESLESDAQSDDETSRLPDDAVHELVRAVLLAQNEASLFSAFASRSIQSEDFEQSTTITDSEDSSQKVRRLLGAIYEQITRIMDLRQLQSKTHSPSDQIKIGYDVRLAAEKIQILQRQLRNASRLDSENQSKLPYTDAPPMPIATVSQPQHQQQKNSDLYQHIAPGPLQHPIDPVNDDTAAPLARNPVLQASMQSAKDRSVAPSSPEQAQSIDLQQQYTPSLVDQSTSNETETKTGEVTEETVRETTAKQVFIDRFYRPWLNNLLRERQLPPIQGPLSVWQHIKDVLIQLDFNAADRNVELRKFKEGFDQFFAKNKQHFTHEKTIGQNNRSSSVVLPVSAAYPPQVSLPQPQDVARAHFQQPIEVEILAAIPPTGVHGRILAQQFLPRFGGNFAPLVQIVKRIATVAPDNMIYPKQHLQQISTSQTSKPSNNASTYVQGSTQPSYMLQQQSHMPPPATPLNPHLQSTTTASPAAKNLDSAQPPHQIVTLKTNPGFDPSHHSLPSQPQSKDPVSDEYSSYEVNSTRGFSFRYLSGSRRDQRERMDDVIEEYTTTAIKSRKRKRFGQYVLLHDPQDPSGPPVLHGFWDLDAKGKQRSDIDWFYKGGNVPADWPASARASSEQSQLHDNQAQAQEQKKPKIRLNVGPQSVPNVQATGTSAASSGYVNLDGNTYARSKSQSAPSKGKKRSYAGESKDDAKSKKKRRTVVDDDDDEYDPNRDY